MRLEAQEVKTQANATHRNLMRRAEALEAEAKQREAAAALLEAQP